MFAAKKTEGDTHPIVVAGDMKENGFVEEQYGALLAMVQGIAEAERVIDVGGTWFASRSGIRGPTAVDSVITYKESACDRSGLD